MGLLEKGLEADLARFFEEDDLQGNAFYLRELPETVVECQLKIKSDLLLCGLPYFVAAFNFLGANLNYEHLKNMKEKVLPKVKLFLFRFHSRLP
jgi:nicotinate-nucleotide pyrophosphorylase (carboxylating)